MTATSGENTERWRAVVGYEGIYEVSNLGRVRSLARRDARGHHIEGQLRAQSPHPRGYMQTTLTRDGTCVTAKVHRLVLEAFVGPCPDGMEGCHDNGQRSDNRVANLRWDTPKNNAADRQRHGTQAGAQQRICHRGHEIRQPNVKPVGQRRLCRACARERVRSHSAGRPFSAAAADRTYDELMGVAL